MIIHSYVELNYDEFIKSRIHQVWAHLGSNQGPTGYEPVALPAELWALI